MDMPHSRQSSRQWRGGDDSHDPEVWSSEEPHEGLTRSGAVTGRATVSYRLQSSTTEIKQIYNGQT